MLGTLRMDIQTCIDEYLKLAPEIFPVTHNAKKVCQLVTGFFIFRGWTHVEICSCLAPAGNFEPLRGLGAFCKGKCILMWINTDSWPLPLHSKHVSWNLQQAYAWLLACSSFQGVTPKNLNIDDFTSFFIKA